MIAEEIFHFHALGDGVFSHRDAACAREIIFRDLASLFLVVAVDKIDRLAIHDAFHLLSIAIVHELGDGRVVLFYFHETILRVVGQIEIIAAGVTCGLVASVAQSSFTATNWPGSPNILRGEEQQKYCKKHQLSCW